jgi:UDP-sulfoquinovose synthase
MKILIAGGDGYIGWPLAVKLGRALPNAEILIVDNFKRRQLVQRFDSDSLVPISSIEERLSQYVESFGRTNMMFRQVDVATTEIESVIEEFKPDTIYHLAQIPSAPFSMNDVESSVNTIVNNESTNIRILWAAKTHCPKAHIIKLGSFGEYAVAADMEIAEGYFRPSYKDKTASRDLPYPREADDVYHVTKINDSNFAAMACRVWKLRITDVMQSTIFGVHTSDISDSPKMATRFDYDSFFGTVLNRFVVQAVMGHELTVYGTGHQRTGLMALEDAVESLARLTIAPDCPRPEAGEHQVINNVTEKNFSINEIALLVQEAGKKHGLDVKIIREKYDPRHENDSSKAEYDIATDFVTGSIKMTPMAEVIEQAIALCKEHRDRVDLKLLVPDQNW